MPTGHAPPSHATEDISDFRLSEINSRLERVLGRYDAMPFHSLLYRLGEVGSKRVDERELARALRELSNNRRPRRGRVRKPGPWEGQTRIFVTDSAGRDEAIRAANIAIPALKELASCGASGVIDRLNDVIKAALRAKDSHDTVPANRAVRLGGGVEYSAEARMLHVKRRGPNSNVNVLVLHEPGWLYPDDKRLWQFLIASYARRERAVIVARAIAPGTFPFLRAIGAIGSQYYSTLVMDDRATHAQQLRDQLGWSHTRAVGSMASHTVMDHVTSMVDQLSHEKPPPSLWEAFDRDETKALASKPTVSAVLRWWGTSALPLPSPVTLGWTRWSTWERYRRGRSPRPDYEEPFDVQAIGIQPTGVEGENASDLGLEAQGHAPLRESHGRRTEVIPVGLSLTWREYRGILANLPTTQPTLRKRKKGSEDGS